MPIPILFQLSKNFELHNSTRCFEILNSNPINFNENKINSLKLPSCQFLQFLNSSNFPKISSRTIPRVSLKFQVPNRSTRWNFNENQNLNNPHCVNFLIPQKFRSLYNSTRCTLEKYPNRKCVAIPNS